MLGAHVRWYWMFAVGAVVVWSRAGLSADRSSSLRASAPTVQGTRVVLDRSLPQMNGGRLTLKVVDVTYGPGEASKPHRHGCGVAVYVVAGAVRMQVRGGVDSVYRRGETFFEQPTDIHQVSANASDTEPARFTATFVCDHTGPLTTPVP